MSEVDNIAGPEEDINRLFEQLVNDLQQWFVLVKVKMLSHWGPTIECMVRRQHRYTDM